MNQNEETKKKAKLQTDMLQMMMKGMGMDDTFSMRRITIDRVNSTPSSVPLAEIRNERDEPAFDNCVCLGCGKSKEEAGVAKFMRCTRCKAAMYCNRQCQINDFRGNGKGPTKARSHKEWCPEFLQMNQEWESHPFAGPALRTDVFSSWANQHCPDGSFFTAEFLIRKKVYGGAEVGYWAQPDTMTPYHDSGKDSHGFLNGQMLLEKNWPEIGGNGGWTKALKPTEYPDLAKSPSGPQPPNNILRGWEDYLKLRGIPGTSIAPLLLQNVLTVYGMIHNELKLQDRKKDLLVYLLGVEKELNQVPLFGELAYLLPGVNLQLVMLSPATKEICDAAKSMKQSTILTNKQEFVLDVTDPSRHGRVRVKLDDTHQYFHDAPNYPKPDAVLALNAGISAYATWSYSLHKIFRMEIPFSWSDQTMIDFLHLEKLWMPVFKSQVDETCPNLPPLRVPKLEIKLNPFHGIVNRDVAAVMVPNIENGYLATTANYK